MPRTEMAKMANGVIKLLPWNILVESPLCANITFFYCKKGFRIPETKLHSSVIRIHFIRISTQREQTRG